jgi:hypothetical protein
MGIPSARIIPKRLSFLTGKRNGGGTGYAGKTNEQNVHVIVYVYLYDECHMVKRMLNRAGMG